MADVAPVFLALASLTFAGFAAGRFFERTRFPDIPVLLGIGLLLGPVNRWAVANGSGSIPLAHALDLAGLHAAAPFIVGLALVVLLFDSGMQLDFLAFRRSLGPAILHTFPIFLLTLLGITAIAHWVLGMPLFVAAALGVALLNVDQAVSSGILRHLRIGEDLRAIYFVEMALYDLLSIPILVALIHVAGGLDAGGSASQVLRAFAGLVSVSFAVGLAGGVPWIYALRRLHRHPNSYMLTFAMTLAVYGLSEILGGSGALSILLFGLLVGNRTALLHRFGHIREVDAEHEKVQAFHDEITFFVRTLFFLFLGISFRLGPDAQWPVASPLPVLDLLGHGSLLFGIAAALLVATLVLARYVPVRLASLRRPQRRALFPVFGRGLDTAVLGTLPFLAVYYVPGSAYHSLFSPWEPVFVNLSLLAILLTVLLSSLMVFVHERGKGPMERPETLQADERTRRHRATRKS
jgi:cell volume regulation protein A